MPAMKEYTAEFKEQAVRFVLEEIEPDESRKHACDRLAPKLSVKAVTLYNWVKQYAPGKARPAASPGSVQTLGLRSREWARGDRAGLRAAPRSRPERGALASGGPGASSAEERGDLRGEKVGFLGRCEVSAGGHVGESGDVVDAFCPLARHDAFVGVAVVEIRDPGGYRDP